MPAAAYRVGWLGQLETHGHLFRDLSDLKATTLHRNLILIDSASQRLSHVSRLLFGNATRSQRPQQIENETPKYCGLGRHQKTPSRLP